MWTKPGYVPADQPDRREAPQEQGQRLTAIPRGQDEELRLSIMEHKGHPYVALRLWARGQDGWWPVQGKGCSIRVRELGDVIDALSDADMKLNGSEGR